MLSSFVKIATHFYFCSTQQCDLLFHYILPTIHRNTIVDLTLPWTYDHFALLIPDPDETANIDSIIKPFQWPVCAVGSILFFKNLVTITSVILFKDLVGSRRIYCMRC
jgi:hypothetical protein